MKARRRLLSWLLALTLVFGLLPAPYLEEHTVYAAVPTGPTEGTIANTNISWKLTVDGDAQNWVAGKGDPYTLTLTGTGPMASYTSNRNVPWYSYYANITSVVVGDGITTVGDNNFSSHSSLERITLPDSVTEIGEAAFSMNSMLTDFQCPSGLKTIGKDAFFVCTALASFKFNEGLETIGENAFLSCTKLTNVNFPSSLTSVGREAFANAGLTSLTIPSTLLSIADGAFCNMQKLATIEVDAGNPNYRAMDGILYEVRGDGTPYAAIAYATASVTDALNIAAGTEKIGFKAFINAKKIVSLALPDSLTTIEEQAFYQCGKIEAVTIPHGVAIIGKRAFYSCSALKDLTISDGVVAIRESAFAGTGLEELTIPDSVETIEDGAFGSCKSLASVTVGRGLKVFLGEAFRFNDALSTFTIAEENPYFTAIDSVVYNKDCTGLYYYAGGKTNEAYHVLNTVQRIERLAFQSHAYLGKLYLPASLAEIASAGIYGNPKLLSIYFAGNAPKVADNSIWSNGYNGTQTIQMLMYRTAGSTGWEEEVWSSVNTNPNPFQEWDPDNDLTIEGSFGDLSWKYSYSDRSMVITGNGELPDFDDTNPVPWSDCMSSIQTVEAKGLSGVGNFAFQDAASMVRLMTDVELTRIGAFAFANCGKLLFINIKSAESIGAGAFQYNSAIKNDLVLEHVETIGAGAFRGCARIPNAFLGARLTSIEDDTFSGCAGLSGFFIPESVGVIGARAFLGCANLRTINIPAAVRQIGAQAFADSSILEKVYFYGEIPAVWGEDSFSGCSDALNLYYRKAVSGWESTGGVWNGIPVVGLERFYTANEDHYSFSNSSGSFGYAYDYRVPRQRYVDVLDCITTGTYYYAINESWQGSCYGMAASTLGFYENPEEWRLADYDAAAANLYAIAAPGRPDAPLTKLIEACQIAQYKSCILGSEGAYVNNVGKYMKLIQRVEEFERSGGLRVDSQAEPIIMLITSQYAGHAVIPLSVEQASNGDFIMQIYDPNYPAALQSLTVNKDFSGIRYGGYTQASFAEYSAFAKAMSGVTLYDNEEDTSVYLSIDKESGNIKNSEGKVLEEIDGAYEQLPFNGDGTDTFSGIKSFVLPAGDYQITAVKPDEEDNSESGGEENTQGLPGTDETGNSEESVTFYMATQSSFAEITTSDEQTVLNVAAEDTKSGTIAIELQSPSTEAETATLTVMNKEGVERTVEVESSNVKVTTDADNGITVQVPNSEAVTIDGVEMEVVDGKAAGSFLAGETENYLKMLDFVTDVTCDAVNQMSGTIQGAVVSSALLPKEVTVTAEYFDEQNNKVAVYTKDMQLVFGWNPIILSFEGLEAVFAKKEGDVPLSCKLTVTDGTNGITSVKEDIMVTLKADEGNTETPESESEDTETKPTENPSESTETKPTENPSESTETKPTEKPSESTETKPTENPSESTETKPTENPSESTETKPTEKPSESTETKPTENPGGTETKPTENPGGTETKPTENPGETETKPTENPNGTETKPTENPDSESNPPDGKIAVSSIRNITKTNKIAAGDKLALKVEILPANATDKSVTWTSGNKKYATVNEKGVVTAKSAGAGKTVTITAAANDGSGVKAVVKLQIKKARVTKVKLSAKTKTVKAGGKLKVSASVTVEGKGVSKKLKWTSSNKKYATVNAKGVVTAKKAGKGKTVKITATATDGSKKKGTIKIKIK